MQLIEFKAFIVLPDWMIVYTLEKKLTIIKNQ